MLIRERISWLIGADDVHFKEVLQGTFVSLIARIITGLIGFLFVIILTRGLGARDAGLFILSLTCLTLAVILAKVGLDNVVVRFVAVKAVGNLFGAVRSVGRQAMKILVPTSLAIATILYLCAEKIAIQVFEEPDLAGLIQIMAIAVPFVTINTLHSELLRGLKYIFAYQIHKDVLVPSIAIVGFILLIPIAGEKGAAYAYVIAAFASMLSAMFFWGKASGGTTRNGSSVTKHELIVSGLPLLMASSMFFINGWVATILLGIYESPTEVALFNVANKLAWAGSYVLISVNSIVGPKFAAIHATGTAVELCKVAIQASRFTAILALPILLVFFLIPEFFLSLFGSEFTSVVVPLKILIVGQTANILTGSASQLLIMTGNERDLRNIISLSALLNSVVGFLLVQVYGLIGVAISVALVTIFTSVATCILVYRRTGIIVYAFSRKNPRNGTNYGSRTNKRHKELK